MLTGSGQLRRRRASQVMIGAAPSSLASRLDSAWAWLRYDESATASRTAVASAATESCLRGIGAGPTPSAAIRAAQNGWSASTGTLTHGTPARSPAAVVPAPAWWTTAAIRGNSQSCGTSPVARYLVAVRPVRRARHNRWAEAVEDRPSPGARLPREDFADPAPRQPQLVPDLPG